MPGCQELKIFSGRSHPALAEEVGHILGVSPGKATVSSFADGETQIQVGREGGREGRREGGKGVVSGMSGICWGVNFLLLGF